MENCDVYYEQNTAHIILNIDNLMANFSNGSNLTDTEKDQLTGQLLANYLAIANYLVGEIIYTHTEVEHVILNLAGTNKRFQEAALKGILLSFEYVEKICFKEQASTKGKDIKTLEKEAAMVKTLTERGPILETPFQEKLKEMGITKID